MPPNRKGSNTHIRGGRPTARPRAVPRRSAAPAVTRRATSPRRVQNRTVKRQQVRQQASKVSSRPRPVVRPASTPKRGMASAAATRSAARRTTPAAGHASARSATARRTSRPRPSTAARPTSSRAIKRAAVTAAGAAAAAVAIGSLARLNTQHAAPEISFQVNSLQSSLEELESRSQMSEVRADVANLDANLNHALSLLESARDKGYKYQKDLEDIAMDAMSRWQSIRGDVEANIETQARQASRFYEPVNKQVNRLNSVLSSASGATSLLSSTESEVRQALNSVYEVERTIEAAYDDIESQANQLTTRLTRIHWALTQTEEACFDLGEDEDLYMAVKARWDKEGKDDPEGILYLTNQRLVFERKEKVATKKVLFIATEKELVQEVLGAQPLSNIENIKAQSKGVFGHQDFLEVDFGKQTVPFHLDGQDSEDWAVWIKNAKSGKIEEERTTGSKLSFSDLTGNLTQADIVSLQDEINELQDEMMLRATQDELSELENQVSELSRELSQLRARGYLVEKSLEADVEVLTMQWEKIKQRAQATLEYQTSQLGEKMTEIQTQMGKLAGMSGALATARPVYINLKSAIASAEAQAEAAEDTVLDQYDEYADEIETLDAHFEWIDWMLDAVSTASFKLLATESGVAAVEAIWERPGVDAENGILYLTDQRLLWEDREGAYELKVDTALADVSDLKHTKDEEQDLEWLEFIYSANGPFPSCKFLLSQPVGEDWLQMVGRARSGGYEEDRAVKIDEAELERIRTAPSQCSNCGAAFTAPILRGQKEIVCEFCGVSTHI